MEKSDSQIAAFHRPAYYWEIRYLTFKFDLCSEDSEKNHAWRGMLEDIPKYIFSCNAFNLERSASYVQNSSTTFTDIVSVSASYSLSVFILQTFNMYGCAISSALLSFNNLCLLNLFRVIANLCGLWSDKQLPSASYSYGLTRVRVLVVFSALVLMLLIGCWSVKVMLVVWLVGAEGETYLGCSSSTNAFLLGTEVLVLTAAISFTGSGRALDAVIRATSAATSPAITFLHRVIKTKLPVPLRYRLLEVMGALRTAWAGGPLCPVLVLVLCCWLLLVIHSAAATFFDSVFGTKSFQLLVVWADAFTAITILLLTASKLQRPLLLTTRTLMQGVGEYSTAVQRSLREAGTVEGVLELRTAHVWSLAPSCLLSSTSSCRASAELLAGSVLVRLHRDAEASTVVKQLQLCLQHTLQYLTLQVYKDDWLQPQVVGNLNNALVSAQSCSTLPKMSSVAHLNPITASSFSEKYKKMTLASNSEVSLAVVRPFSQRTDGAHLLVSGSVEVNDMYQESPLKSNFNDISRDFVTSSHSPHYVNVSLPVASLKSCQNSVTSCANVCSETSSLVSQCSSTQSCKQLPNTSTSTLYSNNANYYQQIPSENAVISSGKLSVYSPSCFSDHDYVNVSDSLRNLSENVGNLVPSASDPSPVSSSINISSIYPPNVLLPNATVSSNINDLERIRSINSSSTDPRTTSSDSVRTLVGSRYCSESDNHSYVNIDYSGQPLL